MAVPRPTFTVAEINTKGRVGDQEIRGASKAILTRVSVITAEHSGKAEFEGYAELLTNASERLGSIRAFEGEQSVLEEILQPGRSEEAQRTHFALQLAAYSAFSNPIVAAATRLLLLPVKKVVEEVTSEVINSGRSLTVTINNNSSRSLYDYQCYHKWGNDIDTPPYRIPRGQKGLLKFAKRKFSFTGKAGAISYKIAGTNDRLVIAYKVPLMNSCMCIRNNFLAVCMYSVACQEAAGRAARHVAVEGDPRNLKKMYKCLVLGNPVPAAYHITEVSMMDPSHNDYISTKNNDIFICCHLTNDANAQLVVNVSNRT